MVHAGRLRLVADAEIVDAQGRRLARAVGSFSPNMTFDPDGDDQAGEGDGSDER